MFKKKYRLKAYDVKNDIYYIQRRFMLIWWECPSYGAGNKSKMKKILKELNN